MRIVSGVYGSRRLLPFAHPFIRPTRSQVRGAVFDALSSLPGWHWAGVRVLDLFCGTGVLGIEALSRGAGSALFVDRSSRSVALTRGNARSLSIPDIMVGFRRASLPAGIGTLPVRDVDLIFLDPPYGKNLVSKVLQSLLLCRAPAPLEDETRNGPPVAVLLHEARETIILPAGCVVLKKAISGRTAFQIVRLSGPAG